MKKNLFQKTNPKSILRRQFMNGSETSYKGFVIIWNKLHRKISQNIIKDDLQNVFTWNITLKSNLYLGQNFNFDGIWIFGMLFCPWRILHLFVKGHIVRKRLFTASFKVKGHSKVQRQVAKWEHLLGLVQKCLKKSTKLPQV